MAWHRQANPDVTQRRCQPRWDTSDGAERLSAPRLTDGNPADSHGGSSRSKEDFLALWHRNTHPEKHNVPTPLQMNYRG